MSVWTIIIVIALILRNVFCEENSPQIMSVVLNKNSLDQQEHVQIVNPPKVLTDVRRLVVLYQCSKPQIVFISIEAVLVENVKLRQTSIFTKSWKCSKGPSRKRKIKLRIDERLLFRPDFLNKEPVLTETETITIRTWILDEKLLPLARKTGDGYNRAIVKVFYTARLPPPYSRPPRQFYLACESWRYKMMKMAFSRVMFSCPYEHEVVDFIKYPLALNGLTYGVYRSLHDYTNDELLYKRANLINKPRFTICIFLYVLEYCKSASLCGIIHHGVWNGTYYTPLIFVNKKGKLHIQMSLTNGQTSAALTGIKVPRHQWVRLVFVFEEIQWKLTMNYGKDFNKTEATSFAFDTTVHMDDTEGLFIIGGSDNTPGFTGYIGKLTFYRHMVMDPSKLPFPSPYHPMFELGLMRREDKCQGFITWVNDRFRWSKLEHKIQKLKEYCHHYFAKFTKKWKRLKLDACLLSEEPAVWFHKQISKIIKRQAKYRYIFDSATASVTLFRKAEKIMEKGLRKVKRAVPLLKQSACLGNYDAMYMLAVILNNGIAVKADEMQSQAYLMLASLGQHRLSSLALGHKHRYGLDGVPLDREQAYAYFKYVADTTRLDKEQYKDTDVLTESIRLTDEEQIKQQTDEDGDVFHWLKHQAQKGVLSAQQNIGRALFWGSRGLKRNIGTALQYLRMGAETQDPQAMYDYGIILLRGHGTEANKTEALTHIKKSAEKKNPAALNALGWYALNHEKNVTSAVEYFEQAYKLGSPDAAFNLGILHLTGGFPDKVISPEKALVYFNFAGVRNQIDAGIQIGSLQMKGTPGIPRNIHVGVEWARFIAEKNPALGLILRKGITAYRNYDLQSALLYYLMAAEAGIEVGSFNAAHLCEDNQDGMTSLIEKDCQWRNYNITTLREEHFVNSYSLIKMGDYHWYGCGHQRDVEKAAEFYTRSAVKGDPHAIFNLGFMLEEGANIQRSVWKKLRIPQNIHHKKEELLKTLYTRCKDSRQTEAFLPCSIALYKVHFLQWWTEYRLIVKTTGFVLVAVLTALSAWSIYNHLTHRRPLHEVTTQL